MCQNQQSGGLGYANRLCGVYCAAVSKRRNTAGRDVNTLDVLGLHQGSMTSDHGLGAVSVAVLLL